MRIGSDGPTSKSGDCATTLYTSPRRLFSPNGAATQSPGLVRPRTYPGCVNVTLFNPKGVAAEMTLTRLKHSEAATPSGLIDYLTRSPRVARASQPWGFGAGKAALRLMLRTSPHSSAHSMRPCAEPQFQFLPPWPTAPNSMARRDSIARARSVLSSSVATRRSAGTAALAAGPILPRSSAAISRCQQSLLSR